jgi:aspartate kinase
VSIVVQKYGGSSMADVDRIRRVAARVVATRAQGSQVCVVVSAMGKTTDQLIGLARQVSPAPPRRELDMLLTCGERIAMALLSMAISELGHEAISLTGSQSGILTNDRHSGARIIEVRPVRVQDELERGRIVIVAGFQGVSYKREITTLGRGGSDTTAVALAAALGAEHCEICSDVDGVYTADPRVVDAARLHDAIACDAMEELAAHGARVLHPAAVELARRWGVRLYARATDGAGPGTRIEPVGATTVDDRAGSPVASITGQARLVRLRARGDGARARLLAVLRDMAAAVQRLAGSADDAVAILATDDVPDWASWASRLSDRLGPGSAVEVDVGAVSVVGDGLGSSAAALAEILAVAHDNGCAIDDVATSPLRVTLLCRPGDVDGLVRALHAALVESRKIT